MSSPFFTFREALEKAILFSSTDWMDGASLKEIGADWISANVAIRKAYLEVAKKKVDEWIEEEVDLSEYPFTEVVKYSYMKEWCELLCALLRVLTRTSEIHIHITQHLENLTQWLHAENSLLTEDQRANYQKAHDALSKFYELQPLR